MWYLVVFAAGVVGGWFLKMYFAELFAEAKGEVVKVEDKIKSKL